MADELTVALTTKIIINGVERNTISEVFMDDINSYDTRKMNIPYDIPVTVVNFSSAVAAGTFIKGNLRHLQIQNLDAVNYARIRVSKVNTYGFDLRLDPGKMFIMGNTKEYASSVGATFATFVDCDSVSMQAIGTSGVDIEYVVAST